jgi:phosphate uptake regulator
MFKELLKIFGNDSLLNEVIKMTNKMFEENQRLVESALKSLVNNEKFEIDVYAEDKRINRFERDVRRKILEHLTINPQQDVAAALAALGVVRDIERVGDYTKNYFELAQLYQKKFEGKYAGRLLTVKDKFLKQFPLTREVLAKGDAEKAKQVIDLYYQEIAVEIDNLVKDVMADSIDSKDAVAYVLLSRYLKRSAAHLANIASSVSNPFHRIGFGMKNKKEIEIK